MLNAGKLSIPRKAPGSPPGAFPFGLAFAGWLNAVNINPQRFLLAQHLNQLRSARWFPWPPIPRIQQLTPVHQPLAFASAKRRLLRYSPISVCPNATAASLFDNSRCLAFNARYKPFCACVPSHSYPNSPNISYNSVIVRSLTPSNSFLIPVAVPLSANTHLLPIPLNTPLLRHPTTHCQ